MEQLIRFFKDKKVTSIIDVGSGTGDFIMVLQNVFPKAKITGIDPNTESLNLAREKYPGVSFLEMEAEKLGFKNKTFDVASISMALHHLPDVQIALKEMQRVVKPGGWIIVNELYSDNLNPAQETHKMYHHFRSEIDRLTGFSHNKTFRKSEILDMVKKSGINILLDFENLPAESKLISDSEKLEEKISGMKQNLEKIKGFPEYDLLKKEIDKFEKRISKFGFQSPPRVVIIGKAEV
jgi:ubiquinone/menaquinone biosynthesis C-methylase UbiE